MVVALAGLLQLGQVGAGPLAEGPHGLDERVPQLRQLVFGAGRNLGIDMARDQTIALQLAQGLGEHLLADAAHLPVQVPVALLAAGEEVDQQGGPLVGDEIQGLARGALGAEHIGGQGTGFANHWVPTFQNSAYFLFDCKHLKFGSRAIRMQVPDEEAA